MSRTDERYNSMDAEARWQAAWREAAAAKIGPCDAGGHIHVRAAPQTDPLHRARAGIVADVLARLRRASGRPGAVTAPAGLDVFGVMSVPGPESSDGTGKPVLAFRGPESVSELPIGAVLGSDLPDPVPLAQAYGADSLRLHLVSDVAPGRNVAWHDGGLDGAWRYCHRLWRLGLALGSLPLDGPTAAPASPAARRLRAEIERTVDAVDAELRAFQLHKAVALLRRLSHRLAAAADQAGDVASVARDGLTTLLRMFAPFLPHLCEELWLRLGERRPLYQSIWPQSGRRQDRAVDGSGGVTIAVHVNGRRRAALSLPADTDRETVQQSALSLPAVAHHLRGRTPRAIIVVPNRILNVVL